MKTIRTIKMSSENRTKSDVDPVRSAQMATVRGSNTGPELRVRKALHAMGFRYRLHRKDLPGRPDLVLPKYRAVVFVHGCFWHRHQDENCPLVRNVPKTRSEFWEQKFNENVERDHRNQERLRDQGWRVFVVWECQVQSESTMYARLLDMASQLEGSLK